MRAPAVKRATLQLAKKDTVALWHAVNAFDYQVRAMKTMVPPLSDEVMADERELLVSAKRALRKVNALRRQGL